MTQTAQRRTDEGDHIYRRIRWYVDGKVYRDEQYEIHLNMGTEQAYSKQSTDLDRMSRVFTPGCKVAVRITDTVYHGAGRNATFSRVLTDTQKTRRV